MIEVMLRAGIGFNKKVEINGGWQMTSQCQYV